MVYSEDKKFVNLIDRGLEVVSEVFTEYNIFTYLTKTVIQIKNQRPILNLIQNVKYNKYTSIKFQLYI